MLQAFAGMKSAASALVDGKPMLFQWSYGPKY